MIQCCVLSRENLNSKDFVVCTRDRVAAADLLFRDPPAIMIGIRGVFSLAVLERLRELLVLGLLFRLLSPEIKLRTVRRNRSAL